jgi:hypothetical protein
VSVLKRVEHCTRCSKSIVISYRPRKAVPVSFFTLHGDNFMSVVRPKPSEAHDKVPHRCEHRRQYPHVPRNGVLVRWDFQAGATFRELSGLEVH